MGLTYLRKFEKINYCVHQICCLSVRPSTWNNKAPKCQISKLILEYY